jgi:signal transduction histidine kinase
VAKPISKMADAARRIGEKDFESRLEVRGTEEINLLADAFNEMAADLAEAETLRQNLLADVSHELRTPLTVLEGQLRGALDNVMELDGEELANLYHQTHHLIRLVNELHELAQAEAKKLPLEIFPTEIEPLLTEVSDIFQPLANDQGVQLQLELAPNLPTVRIDSYRLRQGLHNLLGNSLRYTPTGGRIQLRAVQKNGLLVIEIEDTGEGIDPAHLPHIFDRFYRADSSRTKETGGTGLGLAIVKATVEAQGGSVTAFSEGLGKGSTFSINFPIDHSKS